jgi:hypothetical protein
MSSSSRDRRYAADQEARRRESAGGGETLAMPASEAPPETTTIRTERTPADAPPVVPATSADDDWRPVERPVVATDREPVVVAGPATVTDVAEQKRRFGGFKPGAAFFGWLAATGLATILAAVAAAIGLGWAIDATKPGIRALVIGSGIVILAIAVVAYFAGGYVAGRLARFDGARQGLGVWLIGVVAAVAAAVGYDQSSATYGRPEAESLYRSLTTASVVAIAAVALGTLLAALVGGKVGERYHRRIDRAGTASLDRFEPTRGYRRERGPVDA